MPRFCRDAWPNRQRKSFPNLIVPILAEGTPVALNAGTMRAGSVAQFLDTCGNF